MRHHSDYVDWVRKHNLGATSPGHLVACSNPCVCLHAQVRGDHDESFGLSWNHVEATVEKVSAVSFPQSTTFSQRWFRLICIWFGSGLGVGSWPRLQQHPRGGLPRLCPRCAAPVADAGRRGLEGRRPRPHCTALGGVLWPRGGLPDAAGGWGRAGRHGQQRPLGLAEMERVLWGRRFENSNSTCDM